MKRMIDREKVEICHWCGKVKTRTGIWVELDEEINLQLFAEIYEIVTGECPNCLLGLIK